MPKRIASRTEKPEEFVYLFVYGTLKSGYSNNRLMANCTLYLKNARTEPGFTLYGTGIPFMVREFQSSGVKGEVWKVPMSQLPAIDRLEGHPEWYRREEIKLDTGIKVWAYLNPNVLKNRAALAIGEEWPVRPVEVRR
jgi:gamma-glutamylaminecyclotransferase